MNTSRNNPKDINAGSMADIAFLLLIFFLVATIISDEKGILVKLPSMAESMETPTPIKERNLCKIMINTQNLIWARGEQIDISQLKSRVKTFISNPYKNPSLAERSDKAIVSLTNDRGTKYETYIQVYNEIKSAYNELWEEKALSDYGVSFYQLSNQKQKSIKVQIPLVISEAEPTQYGIEN